MSTTDHQQLLDLTYFRGRVALTAILNGLGIRSGDEVATQAFTCLAVPEGILAAGARPVFVDVQPGGFNLDPEDLRRKISRNTRAIIVQHTFGIPADMPAILALAHEHDLPVIEDCCHTLESTLHGQQVGTFGVAAFYSFEWGKPVVVGVGGSARVNSPELLAQMQQAYSGFQSPGKLGQFKLAVQYQVHRTLYRPELYWPLKSLFRSLSKLNIAQGNYNPVGKETQTAEDFHLVMASRQKRMLEQSLHSGAAAHAAHSQRIVQRLWTELQSVNSVKLPEFPDGSEPILARFPLRVEDKKQLIRAARQQNLELAEWYSTPIHPLPTEQGREIGFDHEVCPQAENRTREVVSLPLHSRVSDRYVDRVVKFFERAA